MKNIILRKTIVIGIKILFIGSSLFPMVLIARDNPYDYLEPPCNDANLDREVNTADAVYLAKYHFIEGVAPIECCK